MDGVVVIDKPKGLSSYDVIRSIKRYIKVDKIGHTGTLDPIATGVLPICINKATKISSFLTNTDKEYLVTMILGEERDTQDITGNIIKKYDKEIFIKENEIEEVFNQFRGTIKQTPPMYSAIKHKGVPLYKLARKSIIINRVEREIQVYDIKIININIPEIKFQVTCSKGSYIRTLCSDIGLKLGTYGFLSDLRRLRCGKFRIENAIDLYKFIDIIKLNKIDDYIISIEDCLK